MRGAGRVRLLMVAGAIAALAALPACVTIRSDSPPSWLPKSLVPTASQTPKAQPASHPAPAPKGGLGAYYVKGGRIVRVPRTGKAASTDPPQALAVLMEGPTSAERANGLKSAIPPGTEVRDASIDYAAVAHVDLSREFAAGGSSASVKLRLAQVVCSLTQLPNVRGVLIRIDGKRVERFGRERFDLIRPLVRADFRDVAPAE